MLPLLDIRSLSVDYLTEAGPARALCDVDLSLERGEALGVVGESGCGKTTLIYTIIRLLPANARIRGGRVLFDGTDVLGLDDEALRALRWRRIAMVFQNAMTALDPVWRIGDLLAEIVRQHHRLDRAAVRAKVGQALDLVRLPREVARSYPHQLSGGMRQRVGIAQSLVCDPDLVLFDEPTTALDVLLQEEILEEIRRLREHLGLSLVFVSHDVTVVGQVTDRVVVMYGGKVAETLATADLFTGARHPYTRLLVDSVPTIDSPADRLEGIAGAPPDLTLPPPGCRFHPRCPRAEAICREVEPPAVAIKPGQTAFCHFAAEA